MLDHDPEGLNHLINLFHDLLLVLVAHGVVPSVPVRKSEKHRSNRPGSPLHVGPLERVAIDCGQVELDIVVVHVVLLVLNVVDVLVGVIHALDFLASYYVLVVNAGLVGAQVIVINLVLFALNRVEKYQVLCDNDCPLYIPILGAVVSLSLHVVTLVLHEVV